jgi:hypothetical protein
LFPINSPTDRESLASNIGFAHAPEVGGIRLLRNSMVSPRVWQDVKKCLEPLQ